MEESILTSIKIQLSLQPDDESFDKELIIFINAAFSILTQLGVGPEEGFTIRDDSATWDDFQVDIVQRSMAEHYVALKVKSLWDAPANSTVMKAMEEQLAQYEWRLKLQAEV